MTRAAAVLISALSLAMTPLVAQQPAQPQSAAKPLTVEAIFARGPLIGQPPEDVAWSPDGKQLTWVAGGEVVELDPGTGKERVLVSRAQMAAHARAAESEEERDHASRYGKASYLWSPDSTHLLFDSSGHLWLDDLGSGRAENIGFTGESASDDPKFSPNGEFVSFIRDHGLAVVGLKDSGAAATTVAPSPNKAILNGQVDWVYEEELATRSNYFWSPDSKNLAYLQMDESAVPEYPITDWIPTHATVNWQRYPQPGDPNPAVRVGVVSAQGGATVWVNLPIRAGQDYIPRFGWADAKTLWIEILTRDQKHRDLYFADAATGQAKPVLQLTDKKFFLDQYDVFVGDGAIVLTGWPDGHTQLYLYSYDQADPLGATARLERQLTKGDFEVSDVLRVDPAGRFVDYDSNEGNPQEQQLWRVSFSGERKQLTTEAGTHEGNFAPAGGSFVDKFSARMAPPVLRLCKAGGECSVLWKANSLEPYRLHAPLDLEVKAHDGTVLYATLLLPEGNTNPASVPLIVNPYGGPGDATVVNKWSNGLLFDELLAEHGFAVLDADNRGMGGRGRAFAQAAHQDFGPVQLEDQLTVLDAALARYPQLDPKRLGWWGWSWGGTFTLYAMTHSDRFRAGVAVAPVTDWHNYDSIYTERYLGEPAKFPLGYKDFSVVNSAANLKGHLLLAHGTGDDNVHMENSVQFIQKLIEAGIPYDFQIYPRKTHSILGPDVRTHLFSSILAEFEQYLKPPLASKGEQ